MRPLSGNHGPDLQTCLTHVSLVLCLPCNMHLCRSSSNAHPCQRFWNCYKTLAFAHLWGCAESLAPATQDHILTSRSGPRPSVFNTFKAKCASCYKGVRFFNSLTSKLLTSTCASGHNGVQLFISHLTTWLRTCRFSEPTFRPSGAPKHLKNAVLCDFSFFGAPASSFFWLFLFSDLLSSFLFSDSL